MKRWQIIRVNPGFELYVKKSILKNSHITKKINRIIIPKETVSKHKVDPGYIIIRSELDYISWSIIRKIKGVTSKTPTRIEQTDVISIIKSIKEQNKASKKVCSEFEVGEKVKVTSGPFLRSLGEIRSIDKEKNTVSILLKVFNRPVFVSISKNHIERE